MKFHYCPDCGTKLTTRNLGDEKDVPWCEVCAKPWFPLFPSAIIALVYDSVGNVLLLNQDYISTKYKNLVSGYIVPGEDAETCAVREIKEETGLDVEPPELVCTRWFPKKEMMMIGFFARAKEPADFHYSPGKTIPLYISSEVNAAGWYSPDRILSYLHPTPTSTSRHLALLYLERLRENIT